MADFMVFFNSVSIYNTMKRVVSSIDYLPESNQLKINQFSTTFLGNKEILVDPQDLIKCKRQTINPFVGYKSVKSKNERYATESIGAWEDRNLLDSMVQRSKAKKDLKDLLDGPPSKKKPKSKEQKEKDFHELMKEHEDFKS